MDAKKKMSLPKKEVTENSSEVGGHRRSSKFEHLFVYGWESIAVDSSEFEKLIMKVVRQQKIRPDDRDCYKAFLAAEQREIDQCFYNIKCRYYFGGGEKFKVDRLLYTCDKTAVVRLALDALEEVPKTWKNAHAIFVTAVKALGDMWEALERSESEVIQADLGAEHEDKALIRVAE